MQRPRHVPPDQAVLRCRRCQHSNPQLGEPRYLMPNWLRDLGWLTPNTWAIEAYAAALTGTAAVTLPVAWLALGAFASILLAAVALTRWSSRNA